MRIIGGALRGRRLSAKPGSATRPTADRVREAIASALQARGWIEDARVLDLFAGTGALGFEALSRGARSALLVDSDREAAASIRRDAELLGLRERTAVLELDLLARGPRVEAALRKSCLGPFSLTFADAPYALSAEVVQLVERLALAGVLAPAAPVVIEHAERVSLTPPACFEEISRYRYGDSAITLWENIATHDQA